MRTNWRELIEMLIQLDSASFRHAITKAVRIHLECCEIVARIYFQCN